MKKIRIVAELRTLELQYFKIRNGLLHLRYVMGGCLLQKNQQRITFSTFSYNFYYCLKCCSLLLQQQMLAVLYNVSAQYVFSHFVLAEHEAWICLYWKVKKEIYRIFSNWKKLLKNSLQDFWGRFTVQMHCQVKCSFFFFSSWQRKHIFLAKRK